MSKPTLNTLLIVATLVLLIGYWQGCSSSRKSDPYISPESEIRLLVEGQKILVVDKNNEQVEWTSGKDFYIVHGERLKELLAKMNNLEEASEK